MSIDPRDVPDTIDAEKLASRAVAKQVAALLVMQVSRANIGKQLGLKPKQVKDIVEGYACKHAVLELSEQATKTAKSVIRTEVSNMVKSIVETLQHHLDNKNLNAIPHALKILGFAEEEKTDAPTTFTVVLPTAEPPRDISAEYAEISAEIKK